MTAQPANSAKVTRLIEWDTETRLRRVHSALSGLRDLCVECPGDIVKVDQLGYLVETIARDLGQVEIASRGGAPVFLADPT